MKRTLFATIMTLFVSGATKRIGVTSVASLPSTPVA